MARKITPAVPSSIGSYITAGVKPKKPGAGTKLAQVAQAPSVQGFNPLLQGRTPLGDATVNPVTGQITGPSIEDITGTDESGGLVTGNPVTPQKPTGHYVTRAGFWTNPNNLVQNAAGDWGTWNKPNWDALLANEAAPGLGQIEANIKGAGTQRGSAIARALYAFGGLPTQGLNWTDAYGDVTPEALAAAQSNPFSALKTSATQRDQYLASQRAALGARGLYDSGAWSGAGQMAQNEYDKLIGGATGELTNALGTGVGDYQNAVVNFMGQRPTVLANAAQALKDRGADQPTWAAGQRQWNDPYDEWVAY